MSLKNQLVEYVSAAFTGLWVQSHEHDDALAEIAQMCRDNDWRLAVWDIERGLHLPDPANAQTADAGGNDPLAAIRSRNAMASADRSALLVMVNAHRFMQPAEVVQALTHANGGGHLASEKQVNFATHLAKGIPDLGTRRLDSLTGRMFGRPLASLTSLDASSLINTLKAIKEGRVSLDAALNLSGTVTAHVAATTSGGGLPSFVRTWTIWTPIALCFVQASAVSFATTIQPIASDDCCCGGTVSAGWTVARLLETSTCRKHDGHFAAVS
jgi:hypothetical protein